MIANPAPRNWLQRHWGLLVLAAILLIAFVRIRVRDCPLERDEGEYAYAGQLMLQGIPPYQLAYNMKFPGTYAAYALIMAVFGQTPAGIHLGVLCVTSLTALLVYWLGRKLVDEWTGAAAGAFSVFLSASPGMYGLAGHATHFSALFATAALCFLWPVDQRKRPALIFIGGAMFGLAILMKQQAAPLALWGLAILTFGSPTQQASGREKLRSLAIYSFGVILPFLITCLILWRADVLEKFWFWTISYARAYVSVVPLSVAPSLFGVGFSQTFSSTPQLWILAGIGFISLWFDKQRSGFGSEMAGFGLASFLTTCPGYYFRVHYFLLMVPAVALLAACALRATRQLPRFTNPRSNAALLLVVALLLGWNVFTNRDCWFQLSPRDVSRTLYSSNPFIEAEPVADYIRTNSAPSDQITILGSEPEIFFLSHRHSATSYIYMYPLMEPQPFSHEMQLDMLSRIENTRPRFVVVATANFSWLQQPGSDPTLTSWWPDYGAENYTLVGVADIVTGIETRYVWGTNAVSYVPAGDSLLQTYQRKDTLSAVTR